MISVVAGILIRDDKVFSSQRPAKAHQALKWEFPGGKIEKAETPEAALERELNEELGVKTKTGKKFFEIVHAYPDKSVKVMFYFSEIVDGEPCALEANDIGWFAREELCTLDFAGADAEVARLLSQRADSAPDNDNSGI